MISRPLRIRYTDGPLREAAAWLIPGSDPAAWLEELARWQVPHAGLVLRVLPLSRTDLRPRGVLVSFGGQVANLLPKASGPAVPAR